MAPRAAPAAASEDTGSAPSTRWTPQDTQALLVCGAIGFGCALLAKLLLAVAYAADRHVAAEAADTEATPLAKSHDEGPSLLRTAAIVAIGLSPLLNCVFLGESFDSVLIAMVAMHWGAMLVLPCLYIAVRSYCGHGKAMFRFYSDLFQESRQAFWEKSLRGSMLGLPVFCGAVGGLLAFRCRTFTWELCINHFGTPLEEYGFHRRSFGFRIVAALYFTFWNPIVEELFWRVFLHRELGLALGAGQETKPTLSAEDGPWAQLVHGVFDALPKKPALLRWGVSCLYASYHTWPIKVVFGRVWLYYVPIGFCGLVCLGRFFLCLRENTNFGLPAAYALHAWIDAAFAALCLFELHPLAFVAAR